jgi:DNA repair protein SbcC/Rad50
MWQPKNLTIQNLMTHENSTFEFKRNKCIMVFGINSTDSGADSNGGGKSTVLEGMTIAITGQPNRDISKDAFINDFADDCYIEMTLTNEIGTVNSLVIKRWFFRKKSSKIELWENDELNKEMTSVNEANARIYDLIGLNKDDLLHFFMVGQETNYSFLTSNDADKKNIISRFSDIEFINQKIEKLKENKKDVESELALHLKLVGKVENKIEFLSEQKTDLVDNFQSENNEKIEKIKQKIKSENNNITIIRTESEGTERLITKLELKISEIVIEDVTDFEDKLSKNKKKLSETKKQILETEHTISHLEIIYEGKVTCPSCNHEFNPSEDIELSEIPTLLNQSNSILTELSSKQATLEKRIKSIKKDIEQNDAKKEELSEQKSKLKRLKNSLENLNLDLKSSDKKISNLKEQLEELKNNSVEDDIIKIDKQIKELKSELKKLNEDKSEFDAKILDFDYWIYHFGKKGFLTFLTNKSIKSIEGITNSYLKQMNSELQILIDGYTILKSGDVREKINISIVRKGLEVADFNRYSGGEKGRIKLANILGLQHLINLTAKNGGLNFLGLDEVFEGLDTTGQIDVLNILERLNVTSLVITHRNQPIGAENEIFIEKVNGISRIL